LTAWTDNAEYETKTNSENRTGISKRASSNPDYIRENKELYDFTLTDGEMTQIKALDRNKKHDCY
jgi:diketogulonate reductase-like aldo/keto reductase